MPVTTIARPSRFLFDWNALDGLDKDGRLVARTGQVGTFDRGGTAGAASTVDVNGWLFFPGYKTPRFYHRYDATSGLWTQRGLLLEGARASQLLYGSDLTNATNWPSVIAVTPTLTTGQAGAANGATLLTETGAAGSHEMRSVSTYAITANTTQAIGAVVKANGRTKGRIELFNGADECGIDFDLTAVTVASFTGGSGSISASGIERLGGSRFWVWCAGKVNAGSVTAAMAVELHDASGNRSYTGDGASGIIFELITFEKDKAFASRPIPTVAAAVTRSADAFSFPWNVTPEMVKAFGGITVFLKMTELGASLVAADQVAFAWCGSGATNPRFIIYSPLAGQYAAYHNNGVGAQASTGTPSAVAGDVLELRAVLGGTAATEGMVTLGYSKNSATESVAATSNSITLTSPWSAATILLGYGAGGGNGFGAYHTLRIAAGVQSMAYMRAA